LEIIDKGTVIKKGAEAVLYKSSLWGLPVLVKYRRPKPYRNPQLDHHLRSIRTLMEAKILSEVKKLGIPAPAVYWVDLEQCLIAMSFLEGIVLKEALPRLSEEEIKDVFFKLGEYAGAMHARGIVHGDLTTSNVILCSGIPCLLDFGLSDFSKDLEHHAVDMHLMVRALESTHYSLKDLCFSSFMEGYASAAGEHYAQLVKERVNEIRRRGRYIEERRTRD